MSKLLRRLSGLSLLFFFPLTAFPDIATADEDNEMVNRLLASHCAQCHGTNGYSQSEFDGIAGEEAKDLYEDLTDMKGEDKPENIMDHQALGYSNSQIRRIAQYYAGLPEDRPAGEDDSESEEGVRVEEEDEED
jgi:sulfide dehydrogenase cytochrome subunit